MKSPPPNERPSRKLTLSEAIEIARKAIEIARTKPDGELPVLYAPGLDQALPANPCVGKPVPEDVVVQQIVSAQTNLLPPLQPIERSLTKDEQQAFGTHWAAMDAADSEQTAKAAKFELWGLTEPIDLEHLPANVFTFSQALDQDWCRYSRPKWFKSFLQKSGYPEDRITLGTITRIGYEKLVAKELNDQRVRKTQNKQTERAQRATVGNQVPEPNKQQTSHKPRARK